MFIPSPDGLSIVSGAELLIARGLRLIIARFFVEKTPISSHGQGNLREKIGLGTEFSCLWLIFGVEVKGRACILKREMAISKDQEEVGIRVRVEDYVYGTKLSSMIKIYSPYFSNRQLLIVTVYNY